MRIITPSQAITKIQYFIDRIERLRLNDYSNKRFRTQDLNKLKFELKFVQLWASIAKFNKNEERSNNIINECRSSYIKAFKYLT